MPFSKLEAKRDKKCYGINIMFIHSHLTPLTFFSFPLSNTGIPVENVVSSMRTSEQGVDQSTCGR
jgi:hypothetical protein